MKRIILMSILISTLFSFATIPGGVNIPLVRSAGIEQIPTKDKPPGKIMTKLKIKDSEKYVGKRLSFKEKIAFKIIRYNLKNESRKNANAAGTKQGTTALILAIAGLASVFIPYAIIASIPLAIIALVIGNKAKKIDPSDKKARTAIVLGWITIGLFVVILIIAAVVLIFPSLFW